MFPRLFLSKTFKKTLELFCYDDMRGIVEVKTVDGVLLIILGNIGIDAEVIVKIKGGDAEFLCRLENDINVSLRGHSARLLHRAGRGHLIGNSAQAGASGRHKYDGCLRIKLA